MLRASRGARNCHGVGLNLGTAVVAPSATRGLKDQSRKQKTAREKAQQSLLAGMAAIKPNP
jgi:hypothetical protein